MVGDEVMGKIIERVRAREDKSYSKKTAREQDEKIKSLLEIVRNEKLRNAYSQASPQWWAAVNQQNAMNGGAYGLAGSRLQNSEEAKRWNEVGEKQLGDMKAKPKGRKWWEFWK